MNTYDRLVCASDIEAASSECINNLPWPVIADPWIHATEQQHSLGKGL